MAGRAPELHCAVVLTADLVEDWQQDLDHGLDLGDLGRLLERLLRDATTTVLKRLRRDDGEAPA